MSNKGDESIIDFYRNRMEELAKEYDVEQREQRKSETQSNNWTSLSKLKKVNSFYKKQLNERGILGKDSLNNKEFNLLQMWDVSSLYLFHPPLRNDYVMKVIPRKQYYSMSDEEKKKGNYLVVKSRNTKQFSLGEYKTSGKYGTKLIKVDKKLNSVLNVWLRFNKSGHLLLNSKREPITANGLTKLLQKTFEPTGKKISSSMIRHIFITENIKMPELKEKEELADKMGHSVSQQELYIKNK